MILSQCITVSILLSDLIHCKDQKCTNFRKGTQDGGMTLMLHFNYIATPFPTFTPYSNHIPDPGHISLRSQINITALEDFYYERMVLDHKSFIKPARRGRPHGACDAKASNELRRYHTRPR